MRRRCAVCSGCPRSLPWMLCTGFAATASLSVTATGGASRESRGRRYPALSFRCIPSPFHFRSFSAIYAPMGEAIAFR